MRSASSADPRVHIDIGGGWTRERPSYEHVGACACRWPLCGCTTAAGAATPIRNLRPWTGAIPPSGCLVRHRGRWHGHAHAIRRRGSLPTSDPSRKGVQRRCGAAHRQFYRPSSRCVCATAEDRARTRGERQTVGCRERRAMSRRFGSPETLGCGKAPIRESPARSPSQP